MDTETYLSYAASHAQLQLFRLHQLSPAASSAYNECLAWVIEPAVPADDLRAAVEALVRRHPAFRTKFSADGTRQLVSALAQACWAKTGAANAKLSLDEALAALVEARRAPFDLVEGPLHRFELFELEDGKQLLALTMHHGVVDGQSFVVVQRELPVLYVALRAGCSPDLPPAMDLGPFVERQLDKIANGELTRDEEYWNRVLDRRLPDPLPPAEVAAEAPWRRYRAQELHVTLTREEWHALLDFCRQSDVSPVVGVLSTLSISLATWSAQREFVVGVGASLRALPRLDAMVGYAVNPLPVPLAVDWGRPFAELLKCTRSSLFEALGHRAMPIAAVLDRRGQAGPAHRVAFEFFDGPPPPSGSLRLQKLPVSAPFSAIDVKFAFEPVDSELRCTCQFDGERYSVETMAGLLDTLRHVVRGAVAHRGALSDLPLVTSEGRARQLSVGRGPRVAISEPYTPLQVSAVAQRTPRALAVSDGHRQLCYEDLLGRATGIAEALLRAGVKPRDVVALQLPRGAELIAAALGVHLAGAAYLPLDVEYPSDRLRTVLASSCARACLYEGDPPDVAECTGLKMATLGEAMVLGRAVLPALSAEDPAYVIYTSGSSGRPKGVVVPHRALRNVVHAHRLVTHLRPSDRVAQITSVAFDPAVEEIWPALSVGASVHIAEAAVRRDPERLARWIAEEQITVAIVPTPIAKLLFQQTLPPSCALRIMLIGGERLVEYPPRELPFEVVNCYGPTEAAVWVSCASLEDRDAHPAPTIGRPGLNTQLYVLDPEKRLVPQGAPGELYIAGENVASGYLNDATQTAAVFGPDPFADAQALRAYRTGDRVRILRDGSFDFLGRIDEQFKVRGYRLEPEEIEAGLMATGMLRDAAVALRSAEGLRPILVATVVPDGTELALDDLRARAAKLLPDYMLPALFEVVDELPRGANGKLDRKRLKAEPLAIGTRRLIVRDAAELAVLSAARQALGVVDVALTDEFFALGGDSLKAVHFTVALREGYDVNLPLSALAERPRFGELARRVRSGEQRPTSILRLRTGGGAGRVIAFHPIGGNVLCYTALADAMRPGLDVVGVACPALNEDAFDFHDYEGLARHYAERLENELGPGPVVLVGYCAGGVVAHAVSRELAARGLAPAGLVLIDTAVPSNVETVRDRVELMDYFFGELTVLQQARELDSIANELREVGPEHALQRLLELCKGRGVLPRDADEALVNRLLRALQLNIDAYNRYRPGTLDCPVTLVRARELSPLVANDPLHHERGLGWEERLAQLQIRVVPGDHYTMMRPPFARAVADWVSEQVRLAAR